MAASLQYSSSGSAEGREKAESEFNKDPIEWSNSGLRNINSSANEQKGFFELWDACLESKTS